MSRNYRPRRATRAARFESFEDRHMLSVSAFTANDVNLRQDNFSGGNPYFGALMGDVLYFSVYADETGHELWKSDGTPEGTELVKDIRPGPASSVISHMTAAGNMIYFEADDGIHGREVWRSDGTAAGTFMLKEITPGANDLFYPREFTLVGDRVLFVANDGVTGFDLWITDGTSEGTHLVVDLDPGRPQYLTNVNGVVYFSGWDFREEELWRTDGSAEGTYIVKDIMAGGSCCYHGSAPRKLTSAGDLLYFTAVDMRTDSNVGWHGRELWRSDGTEEGTFLVQDIRAGARSSEPDHLTPLGDNLVFTAADDAGQYLWVSDGSNNGAVAIAAAPGVTPSANFVVMDGVVYFSNDDSEHGRELWRSDGTIEGTHLVIDLVPGEDWSYPTTLAVLGDRLYFTTYQAGRGSSELWVTDGTAEGTQLLRDFAPGGVNINGLCSIERENKAFFVASDGIHGTELWTSDGTVDGTRLFLDFETDNFDSNPTQLTKVGEKLYFIANDGFATSLFVKAHAQADPVALLQLPSSAGQYYLDGFRAIGDDLYFFRQVGFGELWRTNGTPEGTARVTSVRLQGRPSVGVVGDQLYFGAVAYEGDVNLGVELWASDGTEAGTRRVQDINPGPQSSNPTAFTALGNKTAFVATGPFGRELWITDGTFDGTQMVKDIGVDLASSTPTSLTVFNGALYFEATGPGGSSLWRSDGTAGGTVNLGAGAAPDQIPRAASLMTQVGNFLYFKAYFDGDEVGLARIEANRNEVERIAAFPSSAGTSWNQMVAAGDHLFFPLLTEESGIELWTSDGTVAGTQIAAEIADGEVGSVPQELAAVGNRVYFSADDKVSGRQVWQADSGLPGAHQVTEIQSGSAAANLAQLTRVGPRLYFIADDGRHGRELWGLAGPLGDTDLNGVVDLDDLNAVRNNFGGNGNGDADGDGKVDLNDLNAVRNSFGSDTTPLQAVLKKDKNASHASFAATADVIFAQLARGPERSSSPAERRRSLRCRLA